MKLTFIILIGAGLGVLVYYSPAFFNRPETPPTNAIHLRTGGTSAVAALLKERWRRLYRKEKGVEVDYDSTGSSKGVSHVIDGKYAVGFTHAPLTNDDRKKAKAKAGEILQLPVVICAVVPIYNVKELKGTPPLKFTGDVLARIFLGKIVKWNDPALQQLNEGVNLPDAPITVVNRADSSGTTFLFTEYLHGVSEVWRTNMGAPSDKVEWPVGEGMPRNGGVRNHVFGTEGAIGYVDLLFAKFGDLQYGAVENKDKTAFIHAKTENITAALKSQLADIPENLTFQLTNRSAKNAYPICGCVWAVCYQGQPASDRKQVAELLQWITHDGQQFVAEMGFAPLPVELVQKMEPKLQSINAAP